MTIQLHRDPTVILIDLSNWQKWYKQLHARAESLDVWTKIDPKQMGVPLVKPIPPIYPRVSSYAPSNTAITQYEAQYRAQIGGDAPIPPFIPSRVSDLTNQAKASYKDDLEQYKNDLEAFKVDDREYQQEKTSLAKITELFQTTVSSHLFSNCCTPGEPHRLWIGRLADTAGIKEEDELDRARERYLAALQPLKNAARWDVWLIEVEHAITNGKSVGIPECQDDRYIKKDFTKATQKHFPIWTTSFGEIGLRDTTVRVAEMILRFRDHAQAMHPIKSKAIKAAFAAGGPTLNNEDADENSTDPKSGPKRGRARTRGQNQNSTPTDNRRCKACDGQHDLSSCWYAKPDSAPVWWKPKSTLKTMVQHRIDSDLDLQDEVRGSKRPRSKTPQVKRSESTPTEPETVE